MVSVKMPQPNRERVFVKCAMLDLEEMFVLSDIGYQFVRELATGLIRL